MPGFTADPSAPDRSLATELPEMSNSFCGCTVKRIGWRSVNVTGAMVFQGPIPVSVGLLGDRVDPGDHGVGDDGSGRHCRGMA